MDIDRHHAWAFWGTSDAVAGSIRCFCAAAPQSLFFIFAGKKAKYLNIIIYMQFNFEYSTLSKRNGVSAEPDRNSDDQIYNPDAGLSIEGRSERRVFASALQVDGKQMTAIAIIGPVS